MHSTTLSSLVDFRTHIIRMIWPCLIQMLKMRFELWSRRFWTENSRYQMNVTVVFNALSTLLISAGNSIGSIWSIYTLGVSGQYWQTPQRVKLQLHYSPGDNVSCPSISTMTCYDNMLSNVIYVMPLVGASDESPLYIVYISSVAVFMWMLVWGVCLIIAKQSVGPWRV